MKDDNSLNEEKNKQGEELLEEAKTLASDPTANLPRLREICNILLGLGLPGYAGQVANFMEEPHKSEMLQAIEESKNHAPAIDENVEYKKMQELYEALYNSLMELRTESSTPFGEMNSLLNSFKDPQNSLEKRNQALERLIKEYYDNDKKLYSAVKEPLDKIAELEKFNQQIAKKEKDLGLNTPEAKKLNEIKHKCMQEANHLKKDTYENLYQYAMHQYVKSHAENLSPEVIRNISIEATNKNIKIETGKLDGIIKSFINAGSHLTEAQREEKFEEIAKEAKSIELHKDVKTLIDEARKKATVTPGKIIPNPDKAVNSSTSKEAPFDFKGAGNALKTKLGKPEADLTTSKALENSDKIVGDFTKKFMSEKDADNFKGPQRS